MIGQRFVGLSLCEGGLRAVTVRKRRQQTQIIGRQSRSWPSACLKPQYQRLNILAEEPFVNTVRETLKSLGIKNGRVALSLSDAVGKILITNLNEPLKRGRDGINLLKWQVREQLLLDPEEIRLDFQVIGTEPGGKTRVLVAVAANEVLDQYENLLAAAGAIPVVVLFDSLNLMRFYHSKRILTCDHLLVAWTSTTLSLQLICGGQLQACRFRPVPASERKLYQEVSRTLANWEQTWPEAAAVPVYLHDTSRITIWREGLEGALRRPVQTPPPQLLFLAPGLADSPCSTSDFYAAIGCAERLFGVLP